MNPRFPLYIVSKGRADSRLTSKALERMRVPYRIIIEAQEYKDYASVIDKKKILVLDKAYQQNYDAFWPLKPEESRGSGPARNFAWDHSIAEGYEWHWVMDDNIREFQRYNKNQIIRLDTGVGFRIMEDFVLRYCNIAMAGPQYFMFISRKKKQPVCILNTRIFSCNLIRNDIPFRWRGRYNEDADLSVRLLKAGWCTVLFQSLLQLKMPTQTVKGGNVTEIYKHGTYDKSKMLVEMHPDICSLKWKFGRWHHMLDLRQFKKNKLILKDPTRKYTGINDYGMTLRTGLANAELCP